MEKQSSSKQVVLGIAIALMALYVVFVVTHMARSARAKEQLLAIALAVGAGVLAGAVGLVIGRVSGRKR